MFLDTFNNLKFFFPAVIFFVLRSQTCQQMISEIIQAAFCGELSLNQNIPSSTDHLAKAVSQSSRTEEARNLSEHCHSFNELSQAEKNVMKDYLDETMSKVFKLGIPSFIKDS